MCLNHIKNTKEAKKFFSSMGCSHFHMAREYPDRYKEYQDLGINKSQEELWRKEHISTLFENLKSKSDDRNISKLVFDIEQAIGVSTTDE